MYVCHLKVVHKAAKSAVHMGLVGGLFGFCYIATYMAGTFDGTAVVNCVLCVLPCASNLAGIMCPLAVCMAGHPAQPPSGTSVWVCCVC
jgi:hypothetical protein